VVGPGWSGTGAWISYAPNAAAWTMPPSARIVFTNSRRIGCCAASAPAHAITMAPNQGKRRSSIGVTLACLAGDVTACGLCNDGDTADVWTVESRRMPPLPPSVAAETLLAQRRFLRPIVRALLQGEHDIEDVVQETQVKAWQATSRSQVPGVAWLARIARNLSFDRLRTKRRRELPCADLQPLDGAPSAAEVLHAEELRQRVVQAVLALPQPYRGVVLLRFWEDLPPREIAARLGISGATVRSQLRRGLILLRERLDTEFGSRSSWGAVLAPLAGGGQTSSWGWLGFLLMTKSKVMAISAALLLVGFASWWWQHDPAPVPLPGSGAAAAAPSLASAPLAPAVVAVPADAPPVLGDRVPAEAQGELTVRGTVRQHGQPCGGVVMTMQWFDGFATTGVPVATASVVSDTAGAFVWRGPARSQPGLVTVVAPAQPIKLWCEPELVLPEQPEANLSVSVLVFDRVLHGRVHDPEGASIVGARLMVSQWVETAVTSDATGRYELRVPAPGYPLLVSAPGFVHRLVDSYLPENVMRHGFDVELVPGEQIAGRVVDAGGQPVAAAKVRTAGDMIGVDSDADGRFLVDGVTAGERHEVTAKKAGFQTGQAFARVGDEPVVIVLQPGLTVGVRVVGVDAAPIAGAVVHLAKNPRSGWTRLGITAADGRFAVQDLPGQPVDLVVTRFGHVITRQTVDARQQNGELVITLAKGHSIRGQVTDHTGRPVAGASVYCERSDGGEPSSVGSRADSDGDGRFEITGLPAVPCMLFADMREHRRAEFPFVGGAVREATLRLEPAPAIAGRVVDGNTGNPVAAFTIEIEADREHPVFLDAVPFRADDGRWQLTNWQLPTGVPLSVAVTAPGYAAARITIVPTAAPSPDHNLVRLFAGIRVEGVVRDPRTGQPLAGVTVALVRRQWLQPNDGPATDASGAFAIEAVPPGPQQLRLQHAERPEVVFGPFEVGVGPGALTVQPTMGNGVTLRGRITGVGDAAGLEVHATRDDGRATTATVREDRSFELQGLGVGSTVVSVADRTGRTRLLRVDVGERDVDDLELPLRSGDGIVRVRVDGATTGGIDVRPAGAAGGPIDRIEFRDGTAVIDGLAPGRYRITANGEGGKRGRAEVDVTAGTVEVRIDCQAPR
jgi:RNA polymerase sigma-70 factor (ECF subfamily)